MCLWSMMAFILTTYNLSVQFVIYYQVSTTPVVDTSLDYIQIIKKIVIVARSSNQNLHESLGIMGKTILSTPTEIAEVYLPR